MKHLRVTVQGKVYEVTVESLDEPQHPVTAAHVPLSVAPAAAVPFTIAPAAGAAKGGPGDVLSPLAGKVVAIQVAKGQAVKQGDQVVVLEAMKMNTYIYAPQDGTVTDVLVAVGDSVAEGQAVLKIS